MMQKLTLAVATAAAVIVFTTVPAQALPAPDAMSVLILDSTISPAVPSLEESKATAQGFTVVVATDADWLATTTAEFATYKAIILGDPTCFGPGTSPVLDAAEASRAVWSPAITGNIVVVGTDPTFHSSFGFAGLPGPDGDQVADSGIAFAAAEPGKTGAYITLSCYYHDTAPGTPVSLLDEFGSFTVTGVGCYNDAHIVAVHPALAGLTDASLSDWWCSVHEAFDSFPPTFLPLAIAEGVGLTTNPDGSCATPTFADGTCGIPYIIARNEILEPGETCDPPTPPTCGVPTYCDAACQHVDRSVTCGDGCLEGDEQCDDGNNDPGDGCSPRCTVEDITPPRGVCVETVNPHGKKIPPAGSTTLPGPKGGQNDDGFYRLLARDDQDPNPQIFVAGFGPFPSGTAVKITEAPGTTPPGTVKAIGSSSGQAGAVAVHITVPTDPTIIVVDAAGNKSSFVCLVPPPPK